MRELDSIGCPTVRSESGPFRILSLSRRPISDGQGMRKPHQRTQGSGRRSLTLPSWSIHLSCCLSHTGEKAVRYALRGARLDLRKRPEALPDWRQDLLSISCFCLCETM